jgi:hypothetical protein
VSRNPKDTAVSLYHMIKKLTFMYSSFSGSFHALLQCIFYSDKCEYVILLNLLPWLISPLLCGIVYIYSYKHQSWHVYCCHVHVFVSFMGSWTQFQLEIFKFYQSNFNLYNASLNISDYLTKFHFKCPVAIEIQGAISLSYRITGAKFCDLSAEYVHVIFAIKFLRFHILTKS